MIKAISGNAGFYVGSLQALERAASLEADLFLNGEEITYDRARKLLAAQTHTCTASEALTGMSAFLSAAGGVTK